MSRIRISDRGLKTPPSPIRKLAVYAEDAKRSGVHVFSLNIGQPDIPTPKEFYNAVHHYDNRVLAYNPSQGIAPLILKLADYYHSYGYKSVEESDIFISTGGSEAILFSMMAVASPGEEILVFEPFYPNYNGFAHMAGISLVPVGTDPRSGYHIPPKKEIESNISSRTRAILICSPNNPTGTVLTQSEMQNICDIALEHDLFILSDEVYREFVFDGNHTSLFSFPDLNQHAILLDSLSKRYSACGARIGCIVSKNHQVMETVLKFGQARLCPPTLEQIGAVAMVEHGYKYFEGMKNEYNHRRTEIHKALMQIPGVTCKKPEGAFYMMVKFPVNDIESFCKWMLTDFRLDNQTVMIAPGPGFYLSSGKGKSEARLAYILKSEELIRSVNILKEGLNRFNR